MLRSFMGRIRKKDGKGWRRNIFVEQKAPDYDVCEATETEVVI